MRVRIENDAWLSKVVGRAAYRIHYNDTAFDDQNSAHILSNSDSFFYTKIPTHDILAVESLMKDSFFVVEANLLFSKATNLAVDKEFTDQEIDIFVANRQMELDPLLDIAEAEFRYSRFHMDPHFGRETANKLKRLWIRNYITGERGDKLFVAVKSNTICGFLAALTNTSNDQLTAVIDLIAVKKEFQRDGIASRLISSFEREYAESCDRYIVGTQSANIPSVNLYEKNGYKLSESQFVLHRHNQ